MSLKQYKVPAGYLGYPFHHGNHEGEVFLVMALSVVVEGASAHLSGS